MKRTKRYGGFRIGDRIYPKNKKDWRLDEGKVIQLQDGKVFAQFYDCGFINPVIAFMPNQLINLTRIEESKRKIIDPIPPISEESAKELDSILKRMGMEIWKPEVHDIMPPQFKLDVKPNLPSPYTRDVYTSTKDYD